MTKNIIILGSTGSIGEATLHVIRKNARDFAVLGLTGYSHVKLLEQQIRFWHPKVVAVASETDKQYLEHRLGNNHPAILTGVPGLCNIASWPGAHMVVSALVGAAGLEPTLAAIKCGYTVALANKEVLVMAGSIVMNQARRYKAKVIPVDSEHSAIWQCLKGEEPRNIVRIILTASGGPFRNLTANQLHSVGAKKALNHPTWDMGKKVTIDSATLINKGFEVIEAHHLFNLPLDKIEVVIHPESIVHSLVEFTDGSVLAQLSEPDMRLPIQYALTYPERKPSCVRQLRLTDIAKLTFQRPDYRRFPCLGYAYKAAKIGGTMPAILSAADEVVVEYFLARKLSFVDMSKIILKIMKKHVVITNPTLENIYEASEWARSEAENIIENRKKRNLC